MKIKSATLALATRLIICSSGIMDHNSSPDHQQVSDYDNFVFH
ncbi:MULTISPECIES: hypothetical protein [Sphingobacterium]|nr:MULTISPECIES: hypothetical protein [Sphingobacterium]MCW2259893.1 hypothetical protein [Sphingobacterium kitahiroshimense]